MCNNIALYTDNKFKTDLSDKTIQTLIEYSIYVCSSNKSVGFDPLIYSAKTSFVNQYISNFSSEAISIAQSDFLNKDIQKVGFIWQLCIMLICFIILTIIDVGILRKYSVQINNSIAEINACRAMNDLKSNNPEIGIKTYTAIKERVLIAVFVCVSLMVMISILPFKYNKIKENLLNYECLFDSIKQTIISNYIILTNNVSLTNDFNLNEIALQKNLQLSSLKKSAETYNYLYTNLIDNSENSGLIECVGIYSGMSYKTVYSNLIYTIRVHSTIDRCYGIDSN